VAVLAGIVSRFEPGDALSALEALDAAIEQAKAHLDPGSMSGCSSRWMYS
jgi:hypothetical protein